MRAAGLAAAAVVAMVAWVGVRGALARGHLEAARGELAALERQVLAGQAPAGARLRASVAHIRAQTRAARGLTSDPVWTLAGQVPAVGCPFAAAHALARAADDAAGQVLPPLATVSGALRPRALGSGVDVRLAAFDGLGGPLGQAHGALLALSQALGSTPSCGWAGRSAGLAAARADLSARTTRLLGVVQDAGLATALAPPMLGRAAPRRYLLIVGNDAESRADGGIVGGFGLLTASQGKLGLSGIADNNSLPGGPTQARAAAAVPAALAPLYGAFDPTQIWANANLSPDYPTVNGFYTALYRAGTGIAVDGTITVDPTTLSYLVAATKPAVLADGRQVRAADLVGLVESRIYAETTDQAARGRFFAEVGRAAYQAVSSGAGSMPALLRALGRAAGEGRLLVASNHPDEQRLLAATPLGGALPAAPGPFLAVVTQNAGATKLDYWLRRSTDYRLVRRPDGSADVTVTVRITNAAPPGLPAYVRTRSDAGAPSRANPGEQNRLWLMIYTGAGSGFLAAELDGVRTGLDVGTEAGHPVVSTFVSVDRGRTVTLVVHGWEPVAGPVLTVRPQPLVAPERLTVTGIRPVQAWSAP